MAKPSITKRQTKGAALTYSELDTNFQNIIDATVTMSGDTGSKVIEQIDSFTISGGTGLTSSVSGSTLTINLDNTSVSAGSYTAANITVDAQGRITAASSGSTGSGTVQAGDQYDFAYYDLADGNNRVNNSPALFTDASDGLHLGTNLDVNGYGIVSNTDSIVKINNDTLRIGDGAGAVSILTQSNQNLNLRQPNVDASAITLGANGVTNWGNLNVFGTQLTMTGGGSVPQYITTGSTGQTLFLRTNGTDTSAQINITAGANGNIGFAAVGTGFIFCNSGFRLSTNQPSSPTNGMMYYDTGTHKFRGYANGAWIDLH